jgi:hypothetical protein
MNAAEDIVKIAITWYASLESFIRLLLPDETRK